MTREKWVLGTRVPKRWRKETAPGTIAAGLQNYLCEQLQSHLNGSEAVAGVVSTDWYLYFGIQQKHAHPNCYGSALEVGVGIACTSGHHSFRVAGVYRPQEQYTFSGIDLERLAEHFPDGTRDMALIRGTNEDWETFPHSAKLPEPAGGKHRPPVNPRHTGAYEHYRLNLRPAQIHAKDLPPSFLEHVDGRLREVYLRNSTADGITKPGRKRHASCVFTADGHLFYGVNLRSDVEACDRCSEWNGLGASTVGGHNCRIVGAVVYSPDYAHGRVECCGKCRNAMGTCIDPSFGDMFIRYLDAGRPARNRLYSQMPNVSYADAERNVAREA